MYRLTLADGTDAGEAEYAYGVNAGDEIRIEGNRRVRVTSVIPIELVGEFIDRPLYGVLEVEPL